VAKLRLGERAFESNQRTDIFFFHDVHEGSEADPAFYSVIIGDSFSGIKRPGRDADQLPVPCAEVKNDWSHLTFFFYLTECGSQELFTYFTSVIWVGLNIFKLLNVLLHGYFRPPLIVVVTCFETVNMMPVILQSSIFMSMFCNYLPQVEELFSSS
jgi:hypothetical protein